MLFERCVKIKDILILKSCIQSLLVKQASSASSMCTVSVIIIIKNCHLCARCWRLSNISPPKDNSNEVMTCICGHKPQESIIISAIKFAPEQLICPCKFTHSKWRHTKKKWRFIVGLQINQWFKWGQFATAAPIHMQISYWSKTWTSSGAL